MSLTPSYKAALAAWAFFNGRPITLWRKRWSINQHATIYEFDDDSRLRISTNKVEAWHMRWRGTARDIHLRPVVLGNNSGTITPLLYEQAPHIPRPFDQLNQRGA